MCLNKIFLEHSLTHSCKYCLWLLFPCNAGSEAGMSRWDETVWSTKPNVCTVWPFTGNGEIRRPGFRTQLVVSGRVESTNRVYIFLNVL